MCSAGDVDSKRLLQELEKKACLVRGVWVVQSEFLYPEPDEQLRHELLKKAQPRRGTTSKNALRRIEAQLMSDTEARNLRATRDIVLWCFTQSRYVTRKAIRDALRSSSMSIRPERLDEMLRHVARPPNELLPRADSGHDEWEFLYERDSHFLSKFRDSVAAEKANWERRLRLALTALRISESIDTIRSRLFPSRQQQSGQSPGSGSGGASGGSRHSSTSPTRRNSSTHSHRHRSRTRSMGFGVGLAEAGGRRSRTYSNESTSSCASCISSDSAGDQMDVDQNDDYQKQQQQDTEMRAEQHTSSTSAGAFQSPSPVVRPISASSARVGGGGSTPPATLASVSAVNKRSPYVPESVASQSAVGPGELLAPAMIKREKHSPDRSSAYPYPSSASASTTASSSSVLVSPSDLKHSTGPSNVQLPATPLLPPPSIPTPTPLPTGASSAAAKRSGKVTRSQK